MPRKIRAEPAAKYRDFPVGIRGEPWGFARACRRSPTTELAFPSGSPAPADRIRGAGAAEPRSGPERRLRELTTVERPALPWREPVIPRRMRLGTAASLGRRSVPQTVHRTVCGRTSGFVHTPARQNEKAPTRRESPGTALSQPLGGGIVTGSPWGEPVIPRRTRLGTAASLGRRSVPQTVHRTVWGRTSGFVHTPASPVKKGPRRAFFNWRRGWDSNPRAGRTRPSDFESAPL
jgi:hypothetical protein